MRRPASALIASHHGSACTGNQNLAWKSVARRHMQNGTHASTSWDHSVDLLIVGSGAGAMATGICAHDRGGNALLIEKTSQYGGSSAMSGGSLWIPNNHLMAAAGVNDSPEEALTYLKHITRGAVAERSCNATSGRRPRCCATSASADASACSRC